MPSKPIEQWLKEYADSHQNKTNVLIHKICVPLIFISIYWLIFSIPFPEKRTMYINLANLVYAGALLFWFRLGMKVGVVFLLVWFFLELGTTFLWSLYFYALDAPFAKFAFIVFVCAWIGQFIGHKIEGKRPSFMKDIQFLLIGPIWIFYPKKNIQSS